MFCRAVSTFVDFVGGRAQTGVVFCQSFSSLWDAFMFICEKPMFFRIQVDAMKNTCLFFTKEGR